MKYDKLRKAMIRGNLQRSQIDLDHLALSEIRCPTCNRRFKAKLPNKLFMCSCALKQLKSFITSEGGDRGEPVVMESTNPFYGVEILLHEEEGE